MTSFTQNTTYITSASCTSSWTGKPFSLASFAGVSFQASLSGSFNGVLRLQVSNDNGYAYWQSKDAPVPRNDVFNWTNLQGQAQVVTGSTGRDTRFFEYPLAQARWARLAYEARRP
jgi:hypothetical protein